VPFAAENVNEVIGAELDCIPPLKEEYALVALFSADESQKNVFEVNPE
jgi:hypothetical protein